MTTLTAQEHRTAVEMSEADGQVIVEKLRSFGVECSLTRVVEAPQLVTYELVPGRNSRAIDFTRLGRDRDLAMALEAESISISAPIPGRSLVGITVPRKDRQIVDQCVLPRTLRPLTVPIGVGIDNQPVFLALDACPHLLVAGETGSGKSSALRTILAGLLSELGPEDLRLCLVDVKRVEFSPYEGLPHLLFPVADDAAKAIMQLQALLLNLNERYELLQRLGARDIREANVKLTEMGHPTLPYFVCVVDELSELMYLSRKEVESVLVRIAQKGRAAGVHLIVSTQYPVASILTGLLRVNLPSKLCFRVPDKTASRVVIDRNGAEKLLGNGDALLSFAGQPMVRFQAAYTDEAGTS
jgi:S-DNA-T family DNA segregation ATPase FtsK/SpoIIIE